MQENLILILLNRKHKGTAKASDVAAPIIFEVSGFAKFALPYSQKHLIKKNDARL